MRISRVLVAFAVIVAAITAIAPAAPADVTSGCRATNAGYACYHGPIVVPRGGSAEDYGLAVGLPEAGLITSARATLVRSTGASVPHHAVHLHHAVWANLDAPDLTCAGWPERFFATGKERTRIAMPEGYGYPIDSGALGLSYHLDSMHGRHEVYIKLNLGFVPQAEAEAQGIISIRPVWFDVDNCSDSEFDVPRDPTPGPHKQTSSFTMPQAGRFVTLAGHLHDGGRRLKLENMTTRTTIFTSRAIYGYRWYLEAMTTYSDATGIPVAAGDVLDLTAVYNDSHNGPGALAWDDVMGIMVAAFVPAD